MKVKKTKNKSVNNIKVSKLDNSSKTEKDVGAEK